MKFSRLLLITRRFVNQFFEEEEERKSESDDCCPKIEPIRRQSRAERRFARRRPIGIDRSVVVGFSVRFGQIVEIVMVKKRRKSRKAQAAAEQDVELYVRLFVRSIEVLLLKPFFDLFRDFDDQVTIDEYLIRNAIDRSISTLFGEVRSFRSFSSFDFSLSDRQSIGSGGNSFVSLWNGDDPNESEVKSRSGEKSTKIGEF